MASAAKGGGSGFGGSWTSEKLDIVERYLDSYTTALKNQPFQLYYIDAFAGSGKITTRDVDKDANEFVSGSAERAVRVRDTPFDRLILIDSDPKHCARLNTLRDDNPDRDITVVEADSNEFLRRLSMPSRNDRGVIFLDPFATQVDWSTVKHIGDLNALDMWLLFPTMAVTRMLTRKRMPEGSLAESLTRVYGDQSWQDLYRGPAQPSLFGCEQAPERQRGVEGLLEIYRQRLESAFGERLLGNSRPLRNSNGGRLFELFFCTGSPSVPAIRRSHDIAGHLLNKI